jgi:hypothetical protein
VRVEDGGGFPLAGAVVWIRIDCGANGFNGDDLYTTLVTDATGTVDLSQANITCVPPLVSAPPGTRASIRIYRIDSDPAVSSLPSDQVVVKS